jgi:hypothetical protein
MSPLRAARNVLALLVLVACGAALVAVAPGIAAGGEDAGLQRRTIATAVAGGFRVQVEALRVAGDDDGAPEALVRVSAFERRGGAWRRLGDPQPVLPAPDTDRFFWHVVRGAGALKGFSVSTGAPQRIELSVLITPSIGYSDVNRYVVRGGRLVRA